MHVHLCSTVGWSVGPELGTWVPAMRLQPDRFIGWWLWPADRSMFLQAWSLRSTM